MLRACNAGHGIRDREKHRNGREHSPLQNDQPWFHDSSFVAGDPQPMDSSSISVQRLTSTRIPTAEGEFSLSLYENSVDEKDHLALVHGHVAEKEDVLVRIHSECFTGDVLGSLRCDCGAQLGASMRRIAEEGQGILLYLRQEGRGIGLLDKLRAYDLQDEGYDTVEANRLLGHEADERDYSIAALLLDDLGVASVRLLTNNPAKIESLDQHGISVTDRVPLGPHMTRHNADYLQTKVDRMRHMLDLESPPQPANGNGVPSSEPVLDLEALRAQMQRHAQVEETPFLTLTYAQSLDGSIADPDGNPLRLSGPPALEMTHRLRAAHDAILVGIGTVLADDPQLTVRRSEGAHPRPVVLDSQLRTPPDASLFAREDASPILCAAANADRDRRAALEQAGATVWSIPSPDERDATTRPCESLSLRHVLPRLAEHGIQSVMVEGGRSVLTSFVRQRFGDKVVITISPEFVGGIRSLEPTLEAGPTLVNRTYHTVGDDIVVEGEPDWQTSRESDPEQEAI